MTLRSAAKVPVLAHEVQGPAYAAWVTFVPGIGNDRSLWHTQASALASSYQVLTFDPWGHGQSADPPADCRFDDIVAGVVQLWDQLGIAQSSLVGLGFGGSLALAIAIAHPARVCRVVACCCRARQPDDRRDFWRDRLVKAGELGMTAIADMTVDRWLSDEFRKLHPDVDVQLRNAMKRTTLAGYQAHVSAFIEMDLSEQLGRLRCPVQLVAAEHDHGGGPVRAMEALAAQIDGARLAVIPNSGHLCVAEAPAELGTIIQRFLSMPAAGDGARETTSVSDQPAPGAQQREKTHA